MFWIDCRLWELVAYGGSRAFLRLIFMFTCLNSAEDLTGTQQDCGFFSTNLHFYHNNIYYCSHGPSDGDDQRIFSGLKFFDSGMFWVGELHKSIFLGVLIYIGIFWGIENNLKIHGSACVSQSRSFVNKV